MYTVYMTSDQLATLVLLVSVSLLLPHTVTAQEMCTEGELRLITGIPDTIARPGVISGSVQYCTVHGTWSIVCGTGSNPASYRVICRQLGYIFDSLVSNLANCNTTVNSFVTISCDRTENRLEGCTVIPARTCSCSPSARSVVICNKVCTDGEVRLVGGSTHREGAVEVCVDGHWGTVCNNGNEETPGAVCTRLGFPAEGTTLNIEATSVSITGTFVCYPNHTCTSRPQCDSSQRLAVSCLSHQEVVERDCNLFCPGNQKEDFRLAKGSLPNEGRVEVCVDGGWIPVCGSEPDITSAQRVCSSLGYPEKVIEVTTQSETDIYPAPCCLSSGSACVECEDGCDQELIVTCQTWQQVMNEAQSMCTDSSPIGSITTVPKTEPTTLQENDKSRSKGTPPSHDQCLDTTIPLGAVLGIVVAVLVASLTITCALWRREVTKQQKPFKNERYTTHQLDSLIYSGTTLSTSDLDSNLGSNYHMITEQVDTYDTIDHYQQQPHTPQSEPVTPTPVRGEASRREDDFYDAEEHTYSVVDKKRAKKTPEDGEGETEEPPDYEIAMTGETSWGVMNGESSQQAETT